MWVWGAFASLKCYLLAKLEIGFKMIPHCSRLLLLKRRAVGTPCRVSRWLTITHEESSPLLTFSLFSISSSDIMPLRASSPFITMIILNLNKSIFSLLWWKSLVLDWECQNSFYFALQIVNWILIQFRSPSFNFAFSQTEVQFPKDHFLQFEKIPQCYDWLLGGQPQYCHYLHIIVTIPCCIILFVTQIHTLFL